MTQGAGQGPVVRTATLRDFRVPPYAQVPVQSRVPAHPEVPQHSQVPTQSPPQEHAPGQTQLPPQEHPPRHEQVPSPAQPVQQSPESAHPGNAVPEGETPDGYTPTARDLPVIGRGGPGDTVQVQVDETPAPEGLGPLYVVGDVHGYLDELVEALAEQGLIDADGQWAAGHARLWFLGDFTDRGPDGIGVIDLVMRLSAEAAAAGGYCKALMGNHELLLLGAKRFGDTPVNSGPGTATFKAAWLLNGGQKTDMDRLQDVHLQWMARLDAVIEEDEHLLMHSDTTAYLDYGDSIEDVNDSVHAILTRNDADECWDLFRKFTKRFAFRDDAGPQAVRELLTTYGGRRIVHGHSPIPYLLGEVGTEDGEDGARPVVEGPHVYADGLAIAMDGGVTMAGKLLVVQLPLPN
ncbi:metallophosphoesterase [Streptomyces sp. ISL-1]|uniref:metallophosphoesterase n=1 Tax=Streptomyces sp. ISL-1 TaxID=2817657 RepID=UPI001BECCBB6|nr:metallophosphoesterase [Streptomyces sp. ISL-1]MBT2390192.1 metallophosphoesterase [Streptomyces sp. ISL-1]